MSIEQQSTSAEEREALEFLKRGRKLRGLSQIQLQRIERRLEHPARPNRKRIWLPVLVTLGLGLIAETAVAHITDLSHLPLIGPLFSPANPGTTPEQRRPPKKARTPSAAVTLPSPANPTTPPVAATASSSEVSENLGPSRPVAPPPTKAVLPARAGLSAAPASGAIRQVSVVTARRPGPVSETKSRDQAEPGLPTMGTPAGAEATPIASAFIEPPSVREPAPVAWPGKNAVQPTPAAPAPPPEDPITIESRSFSAALAEWHRDHNAQAALVALDSHERRFPNGHLQLEGRLLRAEILLKQGREREGLVLLDAVPLTGLPRGRELQTVRGELRIKYGRCADGRSDLASVLAKDSTDVLGRRAARAISLCP